MPVMDLVFNEPAWPDLLERAGDDKVFLLMGQDSAPIKVTGLAGGMQSGKLSVALRIDLPNGGVVVTETSLALFLTAADGLKARYGDPRT
jgi:hypothetical protein